MAESIKKVYLVSNGDFRDSAGVVCWPKQDETLKAVKAAFEKLGVETELVNGYDPNRRHGFITKQCEGAQALAKVPIDAAVVVVLSCWAYAHHVCGPLQTHGGPLLLLANFDGTWPGLVALLNHSATLSRLCVKHSKAWTDGFLADDKFMARLAEWCKTETIDYPQDHLVSADKIRLSSNALTLGADLACDIKTNKRIMGQFDPGCMGMINAVMNPAKLGAIGMPIEYLNQSALLAEMEKVSNEEAEGHLRWLEAQKTRFDWGLDEATELTRPQVLSQMKMYAAGGRMALRFGLASIGVPYQVGLFDCCPASDLPEGMWNNSVRPDIIDPVTGEIICDGEPIPHFNEGDMGSGVPQVLMHDIYKRKGMPMATTLHDVRWGGDFDGKWTWVLLISGAAPPEHFGGWDKTTVFRQAPMYFRLGGGTCSGVSKPGVITWARFFESFGEIGMDCGLGEVLEMPDVEVQDRLAKTTKVWPIANVHIPGYGRDELMATHMSNHITIGYGDILQELVATCLNLGIPVRLTGDAGKALLA